VKQLRNLGRHAAVEAKDIVPMQKFDRWITNSALLVFLIGATLHVRQFSIEWRFIHKAATLDIQTSPFFAELQILLVVAFLLGLSGLLIRQRRGAVVSVIGLLFVFLGYAGWRAFTLRELRVIYNDHYFMPHRAFVPDHSFGLIGAHWWDFGIFVACLILFVWYVNVLRKPYVVATRGRVGLFMI
jgi:hypothetical protein